MAKQIECRMNESRAIYEISISGILTNNSLQQLLADLNNTAHGIDIIIGKLELCYGNCLEPTSTSPDNDSYNDDTSANDILNIWIIVFIVLITFFLLVLVCLVAICIRYVHT